MIKNNNSWVNYMNAFREQPRVYEELLATPFDIKNFSQALFNHSIPWMYLLDYTTGRYLMISDSVRFMLGYDPEYFIKGGIEAGLEKYDREHMRLFGEKIFPDRLEFLKSISYEDHPNYIFNYNFRFKNSRGDLVDLLQRNCFVRSDENGNPLLSFGVITNVNHFKSENPVIQVIEKVNNNDPFGGTDVILKKAYYFNGEDRLFTKREKELLLWLTDGLSSKEIANKLFISEYTVINHKRNMMQKCNANNTAELVSYAIKNQLY